MILRTYLILGLVLLGGTGWFIVGKQPPTVQDVPVVAEVTRLQDAGIVPKGDIPENEELEHGIFETPPEDEEHLKEAMQGMDMGGMNMGGSMNMGANGSMVMSGGGGTKTTDTGKVLDMDMNGDGVMDMSSADMQAQGGGMANGTAGTPEGGSMDISNNAGMNMQAPAGEGAAKTPDMDMNGDGVMDMAASDMQPGMDMNAGNSDMNMADGGKADTGGMDMNAGNMAMAGGEMDEEAAARAMAQQMAGLVVAEDGPFDREITLSMSEWTFSPLDFEVKKGERIRFTVRNDGKVLHEFMFMTMAQMQAIQYRAKRADWSLYEHKALFEKSLLLPGQEITFVATITKPGAWMFMCMLPYHMQMGMMGQMATPGAAMKM